MDSFSIIFKPSIAKDLHRLPRVAVTRVMRRIEDLQSDPFPSQSIKLSGTERLYRVRVGDYRIVYEVDTQSKQVTIHYVRHRREVYRSL